MPLVEYNEPRIHIVRGNKVKEGNTKRQVEFEFHPGAENNVPDEDWEHLKMHSMGCQELIAQGKLKPVMVRTLKQPESRSKDGHVSDGVALEDKFPERKGALKKVEVEEPSEPQLVDNMKDVDISKMTWMDATGLIGKVYGEESLNQFQIQEKNRRGGPRKKVMTALEKQVGIMQTDPMGDAKR